MVVNGTKTEQASLQQNISDRMSEDTVADTMNALSVDELKKRSDSLIENIGALRFAVNQIEKLDGYRRLMRDLLSDCRVIADTHGPKTLVRRIDKVLKDTRELDSYEPTVQT